MSGDIELGKAYLFHTHLGIWLGEVSSIRPEDVTLDKCSWIHKQGRMGASVRDGTYEHSEFVGDGVVVPRHAIKVPWRHALPFQDR